MSAIIRKALPVTCIPNEFIQDNQLSLGALGLLLYISSMPTGDIQLDNISDLYGCDGEELHLYITQLINSNHLYSKNEFLYVTNHFPDTSTKTIPPPTSQEINYEKGSIYLVQALIPDGYYKIGKSKNPVDRIEKLGVILPFPLKPIHQFKTDNMQRGEAVLHNRYADKRVNGEWFQLTEQDVKDICAIEFMIWSE